MEKISYNDLDIVMSPVNLARNYHGKNG